MQDTRNVRYKLRRWRRENWKHATKNLVEAERDPRQPEQVCAPRLPVEQVRLPIMITIGGKTHRFMQRERKKEAPGFFCLA